jgi:hypothetical protein
MLSGTPSALPLSPAKLDRMSRRTTPDAERTVGPFEPSAGNGPAVSLGIVLHARDGVVGVPGVLVVTPPGDDGPLLSPAINDPKTEVAPA